MRLFLFLFLLLTSNAFALDYEVIDVRDADGQAFETGKIRVLSVHRLFTTTYNSIEMVELSGLAWSEDEQRLYAISDHGALFKFAVDIADAGVTDIRLEDAFPLTDEKKSPLQYPWSDSEGLHISNADNSIIGDEELLVSFENKPRLAWYKTNGAYIRKQDLPEFLHGRASYRKRTKALESVTVHSTLGVLTTPEYPLSKADHERLILYSADNKQYTTERDEDLDTAVTAIESISETEILVLMRKYQVFAPTWRTQLYCLTLKSDNEFDREILADMPIGGVMPVDNYEGLTHHQGNRYFMVSDNNEHFMQQTLLVYFEVLD